MKTRRRNVSDNCLTITQRNTRSKTTTNKTENSEKPIPIDLIIEIFLRLPVECVARCRCVSKLWASILERPDFTESFLTRSRSRPQLFFAVLKHDKLLFLSAPQPQNPHVNSSTVVCANRLMDYRFKDFYFGISGPVHGFVCIIDKQLSKGGRNETVLVVCNPSTRQSLRLPKVKMSGFRVKSYLGYDPIEKQFKVLSMSLKNDDVVNGVFDEHQILTIETGKNMSWRTIECCIPPHYSRDYGICIDGVLYYGADSMIICFDVRSEKFNFITIAEDSIRLVTGGNLINYNGKLGSIVCNTRGGFVDGRNKRGSIELWVLQDYEKNEWSNRTYLLPDMWQKVLGIDYLRFVGVTRRNEIVFSTVDDMPYCLFYYNIERNTIVKVEIQGIKVSEYALVYSFLDHLENVKLM